MQTPLHARNKNIRNLHRAVPFTRSKEIKLAEIKAIKELKASVSYGHEEFWRRRGFSKPPRVSKDALWDFDLPHWQLLHPAS